MRMLNHHDTLKFLVANKIESLILANHFRTPLHYACDIDSINQVKQLLEKGANTSMKDAKGNAPIIVFPQKRVGITPGN